MFIMQIIVCVVYYVYHVDFVLDIMLIIMLIKFEGLFRTGIMYISCYVIIRLC